MTADTLRLILQIIGVVVGGGILEFARRMLARRAELRNLNTQTDATALGAANEYVKTLQDSEKALRAEIAELKADIRRMQNEWNAERAVAADSLASSSREIQRAHAELARCKADLVVAQSQIAELGGRLPGAGRHRDPLSSDYDWRKGP